MSARVRLPETSMLVLFRSRSFRFLFPLRRCSTYLHILVGPFSEQLHFVSVRHVEKWVFLLACCVCGLRAPKLYNLLTSKSNTKGLCKQGKKSLVCLTTLSRASWVSHLLGPCLFAMNQPRAHKRLPFSLSLSLSLSFSFCSFTLFIFFFF